MSDRPVVVLMDEGSFRATDIFLGAMSLAPSVTLMGVPSGGGSGRSRAFELPNSRLRAVVSTMASFRPDGQLYDGIGVAPDIRGATHHRGHRERTRHPDGGGAARPAGASRIAAVGRSYE